MTRKPHFAIDCTMYRQGMAGMGSYLLNVCAGMAAVAADEAVTITAFVLESELPTFARFQPGLRLEPVRVRRVVQRIAWQNFVLPWRSRRFDAVFFPATFAPVLFPRPFMVCVADLQYLTYPQYWNLSMRWYRRLVTGRTIRSAAKVIAMSAFTASEIERHFGRPAQPVPNPVIVDESADGRGASVPRPFLLVPGSHAPHKNIDALLGALRRLGEVRLPKLVFIGPFAPSALDGRLPPDRGVSLGYVTPQQRDELVAACDGIVVPSVFEGFGMPYAEALLKGKPVIASDIPPARELLGDEALYVAPPYGEAEILQALQAAAQGALRPPSEAAVSRMRALTDPSNVARTLIAMLRDIAHSRRS